MPKISPDLLSVLRCPVTGSPLVQEGDELVSTAAGASGEKLRYAIEDGIPLLLPPDLVPAPASPSPDAATTAAPDTAASSGAAASSAASAATAAPDAAASSAADRRDAPDGPAGGFPG
jgi:uncharacterized protein